MESSSRENATSVASMATDCQTVGKTEIKMTTEMTIILQEIPNSMGNVTTAEKEATWLLIVVQRKEKKKNMTSTTSLWEP